MQTHLTAKSSDTILNTNLGHLGRDQLETVVYQQLVGVDSWVDSVTKYSPRQLSIRLLELADWFCPSQRHSGTCCERPTSKCLIYLHPEPVRSEAGWPLAADGKKPSALLIVFWRFKVCSCGDVPCVLVVKNEYDAGPVDQLASGRWLRSGRMLCPFMNTHSSDMVLRRSTHSSRPRAPSD